VPFYLPLIVRDPAGRSAGRRIDGLRYNPDVPAAIYELAGVQPSQPIEGTSLLPAMNGDASAGVRECLTSRYGNTVCCRDRRW
jgi:arylsulfatase A-like enzyme